jgi:RimJ/RimL family protein N-acetyltransferase
MPFYEGTPLCDGDVCLSPPDETVICDSPKSRDVAEEVTKALALAKSSANAIYFSIYERQLLVGQIFLHDIEYDKGESLVGYHLFTEERRGQGIGTKAMRLLQTYTTLHTNLDKLVAITGSANVASRKMLTKCGFSFVGAARESSALMVFKWSVPR